MTWQNQHHLRGSNSDTRPPLCLCLQIFAYVWDKEVPTTVDCGKRDLTKTSVFLGVQLLGTIYLIVSGNQQDQKVDPRNTELRGRNGDVRFPETCLQKTD
jgi:hypothetical protein